MLTEYIQKALEKAEYKRLEDMTWFVEIPGYEGVWANGESVEKCRKELIGVLEEWLLLKLKDGDAVPTIEGIEMFVKEVTNASVHNPQTL